MTARRLLVAATVLAVLAAVGFAWVAGWGAANRAGNATREHRTPEVRMISVPELGQSGGTEMPDVRGLTVEEARQTLGDAGIRAQVATQVRPAAGPAGLVIQQSPVFGSPNPSTVLLVVSSAAKVPDLAGKPVQDAVDALQGMGARVQQAKVFRDGATVGHVVGTSPAAGAALPETVVVQVADTPTERTLWNLPDIDGSTWGEEGPLAVRGVSYDSAISAGPDYESDEQAVWQLDGAVSLLRASYVLSEDAEPGERGAIDVVGDGKLLRSYPVTSGTPARLEVDLTGVDTLTLRFRNTLDSTGDEFDGPYYAQIMLLEPVLLGSYDQMQALTRSQNP